MIHTILLTAFTSCKRVEVAVYSAGSYHGNLHQPLTMTSRVTYSIHRPTQKPALEASKARKKKLGRQLRKMKLNRPGRLKLETKKFLAVVVCAVMESKSGLDCY